MNVDEASAGSAVAPGSLGHVFWLFGLSGAGKSTLAERLTAVLRARHVPVLSLDGDALRAGLCAGLGFSEADRSENLRRAAEVAKLAVGSGIQVVASFITPLSQQRAAVGAIIGSNDISLIHLNASLEVCRARDVKGLYAKAEAGGLANMTGISAAFEPPVRSALTLPTGSESISACARHLRQFALRRLYAKSKS